MKDASDSTDADYHHIRTTDLDDAIALAKKNPEFVHRPTATMEIYSVKTEEANTGYVYPTENSSN